MRCSPLPNVTIKKSVCKVYVSLLWIQTQNPSVWILSVFIVEHVHNKVPGKTTAQVYFISY
jgi:hypothetical protein